MLLKTVDEYASYLWSNGSSSSEIEISVPGEYSVTATNIDGCQIFASTTVKDISNDPSKILDFFRDNGFLILAIIEPRPGLLESNNDQSVSEKLACESVIDLTTVESDVVFSEEYSSFAPDLNINLSDYFLGNCDKSIANTTIFTDNGSLCEGSSLTELMAIYNDFNNLVYWTHVYRSGNEDYLIVGHNNSIVRKFRGIPQMEEFMPEEKTPAKGR